MSRVRIWTAPRSVGEMAAEELQQAGLPVTAHFAQTETEMYPNALVELWLEDDALLEDESVRRKIDEVVADHPLEAGDEDSIAAMPFEDAPERPLVRSKWPVVIVLGVILALVAAAYMFSGGQ